MFGGWGIGLESSTRADREGGEFWNLAYVGPNPGLPDFSCASSGNTCISAQPPSRGWGSAPRGCRQEGQVCGARCCLAGPRFPSQHDGMSQILLCVTARCLADLVPHRCTPGGHSDPPAAPGASGRQWTSLSRTPHWSCTPGTHGPRSPPTLPRPGPEGTDSVPPAVGTSAARSGARGPTHPPGRDRQGRHSATLPSIQVKRCRGWGVSLPGAGTECGSWGDRPHVGQPGQGHLLGGGTLQSKGPGVGHLLCDDAENTSLYKTPQ